MKDYPMINPNSLGSKKLAVLFRVQNEEKTQFCKGRVAQSLLWLVDKGTSGVTAAEMSSWALRLGHYIFVLRHNYGLNIVTLREPHDGGTHARYVLHDAVEIVQVINQPEKE